eukprot:gene10925-22808_t
MYELNRNEPLLDLKLQIQITNVVQSIDNKSSEINIRILQGLRNNQTAQSEKLIHFEITNEEDPYFLYVLDIGESDFHTLRREQSLLVDFNVFPAKVIDLLTLCTNYGSRNSYGAIEQQQQVLINKSNEQQSSFSAKLDAASGQLSIIEANMFKQLVHITLSLRPGNDASIKAYLASRLAHSISQSKLLSQELQCTTDRLHTENCLLSKLTEELHSIRAARESDLQSWKATMTEECASLRLDAMVTQESLRGKYEEQLQSLRNETDVLVEQARKRGDDL